MDTTTKYFVLKEEPPSPPIQRSLTSLLLMTARLGTNLSQCRNQSLPLDSMSSALSMIGVNPAYTVSHPIDGYLSVNQPRSVGQTIAVRIMGYAYSARKLCALLN